MGEPLAGVRNRLTEKAKVREGLWGKFPRGLAIKVLNDAFVLSHEFANTFEFAQGCWSAQEC